MEHGTYQETRLRVRHRRQSIDAQRFPKDQRPLTRDVDRVFRQLMTLIGGVQLAVVSLISNISGNLVCRHTDPFLEKFLPDVNRINFRYEKCVDVVIAGM